MPKTPQPKGGRSPDGTPARSPSPKRNANHALSPEVLEAIAALPMVQKGEWSKSYLAEQLWRNYLGLPSDYGWTDLELIRQRRLID